MITIKDLTPFDVNVGDTLSVDASHGYTVLGSSRLYLLDVENGLTRAFHCYTGSNYTVGTEHIVSPKNQLYDPTTGIGWVYEYLTPEELLNGSQYQFMLVTYLPAQSYLPNPSSTDMRVDASIKQEQWLLDTPTVSLNLDVGENELNTTKYTITATYNDMLAPINNAPDYTIYSLYDYNTNELLEQSSPVYTSGVRGENGNYMLSYEFVTNLNNDEKYYATIEVHSILGMVTTDPMASEKIFSPDTPMIPIDIVSAENMRCDGYIDIKSSITNINGHLESGNDPDDFISSHGIDLSTETLVYKDDIQLPNNYNLTLWGGNFEYATHIYERSPEYMLHLSAINEVDGVIDIYMIQDEASENHKAVMYVYPLGYYAGESHYYESNSAPIPNVSIDEYTAIKLQYADFAYSIELSNVVIGDTTANMP